MKRNFDMRDGSVTNLNACIMVQDDRLNNGHNCWLTACVMMRIDSVMNGNNGHRCWLEDCIMMSPKDGHNCWL